MTDRVEELLNDALRARRDHRRKDAQAYLVEALQICRQSQCPQLPVVLTRLGAIERDLRRADAALLHYQEAVVIYKQRGNALATAHSVRHVGDILYEAKRLSEAETCYDEALALYSEHPEAPTLNLANAIRSLAVLKDDLGDIESARVFWVKAKALYETVGVDAGIAECSKRLAGRSD